MNVTVGAAAVAYETIHGLKLRQTARGGFSSARLQSVGPGSPFFLFLHKAVFQVNALNRNINVTRFSSIFRI